MQFEEILNNEMSVVVGIVTAILGISYPLLLQVIERIDTKYKSRAIISLLCRSWQYRFFVGLLCLNVLFLFTLVIILEFEELDRRGNILRYVSLGFSLLLVLCFFSLCKKMFKQSFACRTVIPGIVIIHGIPPRLCIILYYIITKQIFQY